MSGKDYSKQVEKRQKIKKTTLGGCPRMGTKDSLLDIFPKQAF